MNSDLIDLSRWPTGTRAIARREDPHPGAQLTFTDFEGRRYQLFISRLTVPSVLGPLDGDALGFVLPHEHLTIDNRVHHAPRPGLPPVRRPPRSLLLLAYRTGPVATCSKPRTWLLLEGGCWVFGIRCWGE